VLTQEGVDVRALIIDDCSTDDTPAIGAELARGDPRVQYRRHAKNMRHIATYNEGLIDWASADYCVLLSADDLLAPGALRRATRVMDDNPDVHLTYGMALLFTDDAELAELPPDSSPDAHRIVRGADFLRRSIIGNPVPTPSAIARTRVQHKVGGYSATLPHTADMAMWMSFATHGDVAVVPQVLAYKRTHSTNMSIAYAARPLGDFRERLDACRELLSQPQLAAGAPTFDEACDLIGRQVFWWASGLADAGESAACDEALALAADLAPDLPRSREWRRLRMKRALPSSLRRALIALRGGASTPAAPVADAPLRQIGWWPEAA
jgi:hypothetical protein